MPTPEKDKSLETWIWDAACSIRGAQDAAKYKDFILPLIFTKRLCGSKEHVGKTAFFDLTGEWTHSSFILRIRPHASVNGRFLFHYLIWLRESKYFIRLHNYAVNAKFNKSAINAMPVPLPERSEQDVIAASIDDAIHKANNHRVALRLLQELFRTLLHQLMTAQIRVHDVDLSELGIETAPAELVEVA
jgi:hypothetical protein